MKSYKKSQIDFLKALVLKVGNGFGDLHTVSRTDLNDVATSLGYRVIPIWITGDKDRHESRGMYSFPELANPIDSLVVISDTRGRPRKYVTTV